MRRILLLAVLAQGLLVAAFTVGLRSGRLPLGVRGEWEWLRLPRGVSPGVLDLAIGFLAVAAFAGFAAAGRRFLDATPSAARQGLALAGLWLAAIAVQASVRGAAPPGYGLSKWALALYNPGSSGYYTVARGEIRDLRTFLKNYPDWIARQDALHIGTHPPGLFVEAHLLRSAMMRSPDAARFVDVHAPPSVEAGFRAIGAYDPLPRADRASLTVSGALTLLACASTVVPLYLLARATLPAPAAWSAAALWPLVPSAILFQPTADTAFPLLSTTALALAALASRSRPRAGLVLAFTAGLVLGLGMQLSLVFLPIGLIAGIVLGAAGGIAPRNRALLVGATGAGFLALTLAVWGATDANPFVVWWWNQKNHARFYQEYPRSYGAWVLANPIELATALGLPAAVWAAVGLWPPRGASRVAWSTVLVLAFLTLGGRTLSEVARLWLPMMPALLVASARGLAKLGGGASALSATIGLVGVETLILQATIQVVYPV